MEIILKMWKDTVWSKITATGFIIAIGFLISYLAGWLPSVGIYLKSSWAWLFHTTDISNWLLILISIPCLLVLYIMVLWIKSLGSAEGNFQSYLSDTFLV